YDPSMSNELRYNFFHGVHRNRKADTCARAARTVNHGINAHQFPFRVEQGTAGVTRINGRVGLNNIGNSALRWRLDLAPQCTHNTGGQRGIQSKRIADGEHFTTYG